MNAYDFDKTIYKKDSTVSFYLFCIKKCPRCLKYLPIQAFGFIKYTFGFIGKTELKEKFFSFLKAIDDIDSLVSEYWEKNAENIDSRYLEKQQPDDILISASPEFLLAPICQKLGISNLIASEVDRKTGKFLSPNCYGREKVNRLLRSYREEDIDCFYSDSQSDEPMARISKQAYIVKEDKIIPWDSYKPSKLSVIKHAFLSAEFIAFLFIGIVNAINGVLFASLFSLLTNPNLAFIIGYLCSLTISYFLNTFLAFKERPGFLRYIKFCISYIPNFLIQNGLVLLLYNKLGINYILVYALAVAIAVPITFLMLKFYAFAKKRKPSSKNK